MNASRLVILIVHYLQPTLSIQHSQFGALASSCKGSRAKRLTFVAGLEMRAQQENGPDVDVREALLETPGSPENE